MEDPGCLVFKSCYFALGADFIFTTALQRILPVFLRTVLPSQFL